MLFHSFAFRITCELFTRLKVFDVLCVLAIDVIAQIETAASVVHQSLMVRIGIVDIAHTGFVDVRTVLPVTDHSRRSPSVTTFTRESTEV